MHHTHGPYGCPEAALPYLSIPQFALGGDIFREEFPK
jgi:hypothetical protein